MTVEPCALIPWDSAFWGMPIARVVNGRLTPEDVPAIERWCAANGIRCLYLLLPCDDSEGSRTAAESSFRQVDVRLRFERRLDDRRLAPLPPGIQPAIPEDAPALREIAAASHGATRFFADGRFPRDGCRELYATWIERSIGGYAEQTLIHVDDRGPAGYITLHLPEGECAGTIGLLAVAERARRRGAGRALVEAGLDWLAAHGAERASVVTQGANLASRALYERAGFAFAECGLWHHRWFVAGEGAGS
ncbi:MAG: GNAT family N-acetyltransferase [Thermomicrobiales bacterium]